MKLITILILSLVLYGGGRPSKNTPKDMRLAANNPNAGKPATSKPVPTKPAKSK